MFNASLVFSVEFYFLLSFSCFPFQSKNLEETSFPPCNNARTDHNMKECWPYDDWLFRGRTRGRWKGKEKRLLRVAINR